MAGGLWQWDSCLQRWAEPCARAEIWPQPESPCVPVPTASTAGLRSVLSHQAKPSPGLPSIPFKKMGLFFKSSYWRSKPFNIGIFKCVDHMACSTAKSSARPARPCVLLLKPRMRWCSKGWCGGGRGVAGWDALLLSVDSAFSPLSKCNASIWRPSL